ncbi:MAG: T9SS type A sorting domain-containing protein [Bacteroidales bacterium]|nr:T9SS type A sorting domain-containing protein [Bacteroidales bacterium]
MKKQVLIILFLVVQSILLSQNVFNRIIEDTIAHITSSVLASDTGYILLTGTGNEHGNRSFAISSIDLNGDRQWKKIYGDNQDQYWEGYANSIKKDGLMSQSSGVVRNVSANEWAIFIFTYDSIFNIVDSAILERDIISKRCFNQIKSSDNCYYLSGAIVCSDTETLYLLLLKLNLELEIIWRKTYTLANISEAGDQILETKDSNILIGGTTFTNSTNQDWYILKTDTAGNIIWEHNYGHNVNSDGIVKGLIETQDSCYLACGGYPAAHYGQPASGETLYDGCLRKITKDGDLMWTKYFRTFSKYTTAEQPITMLNTINSMFEDSLGNIYMVGTTYSSKPFYRGYLTKLNNKGDIIFHRQYYAIDQFSNQQYLTVLQPTSDGGVVLAGYGNAYDWYGYDPPQQAWLVKTDSLGLDGLSNIELPELNIDIEFPETICMSDTISVYAYIAGKSAPYTIETSIGQIIDSIYYPPTFVPVEIGLTHVNLDFWGTTYFQQTITEATLTNHAWGQCIAKPVEFYTPITSGLQEVFITVTDAYGESKTITKEVNVIDCETENITENANSGFKIYPNPAKDRVFVNIPEMVTSAPLSHQICHQISMVEIINAAGQVVLTKNISTQETEINIKELVAGSYVVRVYCGNKIENLRFEKI